MRRRLGFPARLLERAAKHEFDLSIQAAQIVVGPALQRVEHGAIDPEQKRLAFGHDG
jgi:hypothetical protein